MLQEENKAGTHLTVGSLEVLQNFTGPGITRIVQSVEQTNQTVSNLAGEVDRGYREAAADDMITPTEKKTLKKQWNEIQQTYAAILNTANNKQLDDDPIMSTLTAKYASLSSYLDQIQLFANMNETTQIASSAAFQQKFDEYYSAQIYSQTLISGAKILENITDSGSKGEFAQWNGRLYYNNGDTWVLTDTSGYLGAVSSGNPDRQAGNFFLATASWSINPTTLFMLDVGDGYVLGAGEYVLGVTENFTRGMIYVSDGVAWKEISDVNNYRYVVALSDIKAAGLPIPEKIKTTIEDTADDALSPSINQAQLTADNAQADATQALNSVAELESDIPELVQTYVPKSYHMVTAFPDDAHTDDWCVWNGDQTNTKGDVYQYDGTTWQHRLPTDDAYTDLYMQSLSDVIDVAGNVDGRFAVILSKKIIAQQAVIDELSAKFITLKAGGVIKSLNFNGTINSSGIITSYGTTGFALDNAGKINGVGAVFTDGRFSGQLDCDVMKVEKENIYSLITHYTTSQAEAFVRYYCALAGGRGDDTDIFTVDTTVNALFGANNYIVLDDGARYTGRVLLKAFSSRNSHDSQMYIYPNGTEVIIGGSYRDLFSPLTYYINYDYKQTYEITGATSLVFTGSLPSSDPHIAGRAWQADGYLRISQG